MRRSGGLVLVLLVWAIALDLPAFGASTALPQAPEIGPALKQRLFKALTAKRPGYVPRTRHLQPDRGPKYTNRLILESSPYLQQHAHNPVNWYPWGEEAFRDAKRLGRPILLSIGYSTCHWCHVMEEESFEDLEIAAYLNAHYIPIKVDREERPDLDAIYMKAVQMITGRGGWPMTTWLTPEAEPFYGGTYFPARDGDRGSRTGFLSLLKQLSAAYRQDPAKVAASAKQVAARIKKSMKPAPGDTMPTSVSLKTAGLSYKGSFDPRFGGNRRAPKFPSSFPVRFLLREHRRTGNPEYLSMATFTLSKMAAGGMYDQIGGGFHRYSTDARWLVPHFEKMLYDNALLVLAYVEAYQATGSKEFAEVAAETLRYVAREMTSPGGGFYSATDADSPTPDGHREEGWFFTWTPDELKEILGDDEAGLVMERYGVTAAGNFEGRSIFHGPRSLDGLAARRKQPVSELSVRLNRSRDRLYEARLERPGPLLDDKVLAAWNGLMISAMARGGFALDMPEHVDRAGRAADFVLKNLRRDGRLKRSYRGGELRYEAYLDDYAFLIAGLLDLYEVTSELRWMQEAIALQAELDEHYVDEASGGYFMTRSGHVALLAREKPSYDGAEPSGNSVAAMNLVRLGEFTGIDRYRAAADDLFRAFSAGLTRTPTALSRMLLALDYRLDAAQEIVIVTPSSRDEAEPFLAVLRRTFLPNQILAVVPEQNISTHSKLVPLLSGKVARRKMPTAYVCEKGVCKLPTTDVATFEKQLATKGRSPETPVKPAQNAD